VRTAFPNNGPLSGMIITGISAVLALLLGLFVPSSHPVFAAPATDRLLDAFLITILAMVVHKVESYWTGEYARCPVYLTSVHRARGQHPGRLLFQGFVPAVLGGLVLLYFMMRGPPWVLLLLLVWLGQGLHEWHHAAKTLAERRYYPGTVSGLLFVGLMDGLLYPAWSDALPVEPGGWLSAYYAAQPVMFAAYWLEHRGWIARYRAWLESGGGAEAVRG
jgi:hypothetical protein